MKSFTCAPMGQSLYLPPSNIMLIRLGSLPALSMIWMETRLSVDVLINKIGRCRNINACAHNLILKRIKTKTLLDHEKKLCSLESRRVRAEIQHKRCQLYVSCE